MFKIAYTPKLELTHPLGRRKCREVFNSLYIYTYIYQFYNKTSIKGPKLDQWNSPETNQPSYMGLVLTRVPSSTMFTLPRRREAQATD